MQYWAGRTEQFWAPGEMPDAVFGAVPGTVLDAPPWVTGHGGLCVQQFESKFLQHDADLDLRLEITPLGARNALMPGHAPEKCNLVC